MSHNREKLNMMIVIQRVKDHEFQSHWYVVLFRVSDSISPESDPLNPGEKYFPKFSLLKNYIFKKSFLLFQYFSP